MLGEQLRKIREEKGHTQEHLSALANVSAATIQRIESSEILNPRRGTLERLAAALKVSVAQLAGDEEREANAAIVTQAVATCDNDDLAILATIARRLCRDNS